MSDSVANNFELRSDFGSVLNGWDPNQGHLAAVVGVGKERACLTSSTTYGGSSGSWTTVDGQR